MSKSSDRSALIVGSTGIVGNNLADRLLADGWSVAGLARKAVASPPGLRPVVADLLRPDTLATGLAGLRPTHVFFSTWLRHDTEAENIRVNGAMVRNLLDAVRPIGQRAARRARHRAEALPRAVRGVREGQPARHALPRRAGPARRSKTSTTPRRMRSSPRPSVTASPGACTGRTRSSATRSATR